MLETSNPVITQSTLLSELQAQIAALNNAYPVVLFGLRGYNAHLAGQGVNKRGIYDDAIGLMELSKSDGAFLVCSGNTDPSATNVKGLATLNPGTWFFRRGKHGIAKGKPYDAFVQAKPFTVTRDQQGEDTGMFGINIHRGGNFTTGSLGCQTLPPSHWDAFQSLGYMLTKQYNMDLIPYILVREV